MNIKRRNSLLTIETRTEINEADIISEALTTPYEKVIKILLNIKSHLTDESLLKDINWVLEHVQSQKWYTYESSDQTEEYKKFQNVHEVKSFFDYLSNYSENKETKRRNKKSKTVLVPERIFNKKLYQDTSLHRSLPDLIDNNKEHISLKFIDNEDSDSQKCDMELSPINKRVDDDEENIQKVVRRFSIRKCDENTIIDQKNKNIQENWLGQNEEKSIMDYLSMPLYDFEKISSFEFDIFEFDEAVGRSNVLIQGATHILDNSNLTRLIEKSKLESFLRDVRNGYKNNGYHSNLHGFDVCQTVYIYLTKAPVAEILYLTDYDILAFVLSSLIHDLGHPGLNNTFQVNTMSEIARTYNDKSVLENFHVSEAFKILGKPESNILEKIEFSDFRIIRKRIIECVMATDMVHHAKVQTLVKNRLSLNNICNGVNQDKLLNKDSSTFFDDQQEILNFLLHTADLSHNSKKFEISHKWTYLLMDEFWKQGDLEVSLNIPVSFLCDRLTAEVPKSQIGFITGIITPCFDVLIGFLPSLVFYYENVQENIEKWREIINVNRDKKSLDGQDIN